VSLVLAGELDVQGLAQQHPGNAAQADEHKGLLQLWLGLEHEFVATLGRLGVLEQHHVDEHDQDRGSATWCLRLEASPGVVAEPLEEPVDQKHSLVQKSKKIFTDKLTS